MNKDYSKSYMKALRKKLEKVINGNVSVYMNDYDEIIVEIYVPDFDVHFTFNAEEPFSNIVIKGFSVEDAAEEITIEYMEFVFEKFFKLK